MRQKVSGHAPDSLHSGCSSWTHQLRLFRLGYYLQRKCGVKDLPIGVRLPTVTFLDLRPIPDAQDLRQARQAS